MKSPVIVDINTDTTRISCQIWRMDDAFMVMVYDMGLPSDITKRKLEPWEVGTRDDFIMGRCILYTTVATMEEAKQVAFEKLTEYIK